LNKLKNKIKLKTFDTKKTMIIIINEVKDLGMLAHITTIVTSH